MLAGNYASTVSATAVAASGASLSQSLGNSMTAFGDVFPTATLKWGLGVHNVMAYVTANVPLGAYDVARQASVGLGRWAVDGGAGYTWFDEEKGHAFGGARLHLQFHEPLYRLPERYCHAS